MHPVLLDLGAFQLHAHGAALALALLVVLWWTRAEGPRLGLDPAHVPALGLAALLGAWVGGRLAYGLVTGPAVGDAPGPFAASLAGGGSSVGAGLGALAAVAWVASRRRQPLLPWLHAAAPGCALAVAVARLGCLGAGCAWGRPTDLAWGITFTDPAGLAPTGQALHPTQPLLAGVGLATFMVLLALRGRLAPHSGRLVGVLLLTYAGLRFPVEFLRGDGVALWGPVSANQVALATMLVAGALLASPYGGPRQIPHWRRSARVVSIGGRRR